MAFVGLPQLISGTVWDFLQDRLHGLSIAALSVGLILASTPHDRVIVFVPCGGRAGGFPATIGGADICGESTLDNSLYATCDPAGKVIGAELRDD
jgi:hypothetical protein